MTPREKALIDEARKLIGEIASIEPDESDQHAYPCAFGRARGKARMAGIKLELLFPPEVAA